MLKTLRISFALKNTYRVNSILYSLRQIPLLGRRLLPAEVYQVWGYKIFANILSILWEIISAFGGKLLYFLVMLLAPMGLLEPARPGAMFLHILVFLTLIGAFLNDYLFDPTRDKYYAMILLGMDAREYTLVNYFYAIFKLLVGFALFGGLFGNMLGLAVWQWLPIPLYAAAVKLASAALSLTLRRRGGDPERKPAGKTTAAKAIAKAAALVGLLAGAYALPLLGYVLPLGASLALMLLALLTLPLSLRVILRFPDYRQVYRQELDQSLFQTGDLQTQVLREQSRDAISADASISSRKRGFEYLNELFVKRHRKILWRTAQRLCVISLVVVALVLLVIALIPEARAAVNAGLMRMLPYSVFLMYLINRGPGFTRALFINCDHSLLTYPFYKQPRHILKLFQIRLRELIKVNLLPASAIAAGLALWLFASGGTGNPLNYAALIVSILSLSVFFSVHYLTLYYLLQPYNAGTEVKSAAYQFIMWATYAVSYIMLQVRLPTLLFGLAAILFCLVYCVVASVLVYKLAPKTFRLRT